MPRGFHILSLGFPVDGSDLSFHPEDFLETHVGKYPIRTIFFIAKVLPKNDTE